MADPTAAAHELIDVEDDRGNTFQMTAADAERRGFKKIGGAKNKATAPPEPTQLPAEQPTATPADADPKPEAKAKK